MYYTTVSLEVALVGAKIALNNSPYRSNQWTDALHHVCAIEAELLKRGA